MAQAAIDRHDTPHRSHGVTWLFVILSFVPTGLALYAADAFTTSFNETWPLLLAIVTGVAVGLFIGFKVRPLSQGAAPMVFAAPLINLVLLGGIWLSLSLSNADENSLRSMVYFLACTPILLGLSTPAAGIARLVHFFRDSRS